MTSQGQRFRRRALRRGYKVDEVDSFLDRVDATLAGNGGSGTVTAQEVHDVEFRTRLGGYDEWQVDLHLDRVERQLAEFEERGGAPRVPESRSGEYRATTPPADRMAPGPGAGTAAERFGQSPDRMGAGMPAASGAAPMGAMPAGSGVAQVPGMVPADRFGQPDRMGQPDRYGPPDRMSDATMTQSLPTAVRGPVSSPPATPRGPISSPPATARGSISSPPATGAGHEAGYGRFDEPGYERFDESAHFDEHGRYDEPARFDEHGRYDEAGRYDQSGGYDHGTGGYDQASRGAAGARGAVGAHGVAGVAGSTGVHGVAGRAQVGGYDTTGGYEARGYESRGFDQTATGGYDQAATGGYDQTATGGYSTTGGYDQTATGGYDATGGYETQGRYPAATGYESGAYDAVGYEAGRHGRSDMTTEMRVTPEAGAGGYAGGQTTGQWGYDERGTGTVPVVPASGVPSGVPGGAAAGPALTGDAARVDQLRRNFQPRRFGSGYDRTQVDQLFEAVISMLTGRGPVVFEAALDPSQLELVSGGYFEAEVNAALKEVRDLLRRL